MLLGGVAGLRLRQWWEGRIGAILGLGPAAVGFVTENPIAAFLAPLACVLGGYLLQKAAMGWMRAAPPHPPETQTKSEPRLDDLIGEYEKCKEQHGPWVEDGRERQ